MKKTYEIGSYDPRIGEYVPGENLTHVVKCGCETDAYLIAELLRGQGYGVIVWETKERTEINRREIVAEEIDERRAEMQACPG